jgi:hypothetical protein
MSWAWRPSRSLECAWTEAMVASIAKIVLASRLRVRARATAPACMATFFGWFIPSFENAKPMIRGNHFERLLAVKRPRTMYSILRGLVMDEGLLLARMILALATVIFALSILHSANAEPATRGCTYQRFNLLSSSDMRCSTATKFEDERTLKVRRTQ